MSVSFNWLKIEQIGAFYSVSFKLFPQPKSSESEAVPDLVAHLVLLLPPPPIRLSMSIKRQTGEAFDPAGTKPVDYSTILGLKRVHKLSPGIISVVGEER